LTILIILACLAALGLLGAALQAIALAMDAQRFPVPGKLYDIGGTRLHMSMEGEGWPIVLFDAGIAATSLSWRLVQPEVAKVARAASYDRAGLGWSDPAIGARTAERAAADLHAMLGAAGIHEPLILVGHSYGGLVARAFANRYRGRVAGMVLVDPVAAAEWAEPSRENRQRLARAIRLSRRGALLARLGVVRFALSLISTRLRGSSKVIARAASRRSGQAFTERMAAEIGKLPREVWPIVKAHWCDPKCFESLALYLESLPESCAAELAMSAPGSLGDLPLVIFSADIASDAQRAEHRLLCGLSTRARLKAVPGGHWIQLDRPAMIAEAIREMVEQARSARVS
jgi:pimeloyl-ACP methyl ester carboxylesterase